MNFICKIIEHKSDEGLLIVKYCRQNSPKSIDDYPSYAINCNHLDFTSYETFVESLIKCGMGVIIDQIAEEPGLECNCEDTPSYSTDIEENLNKILCVDYKKIIFGENVTRKIDL